MGIGLSNLNNNLETYSSTYSTNKKTDNNEAVAENKKTDNAANAGAVYEKSDNSTKKGTYSINKMSSSDRAAIVAQMKADQENRTNQLMSLVQYMLSKQAGKYNTANGDDIWKFLASGEYTVDEAARAKAQEEISEDGYWGVNQTSQRMFDFASALAGDDVDKMKDMQAAMEKGYNEATKSWGKELPEICKQTLDAANKLFEEYYASKEV